MCLFKTFLEIELLSTILLKHFFFIPFLFMSILSLGCFNKPIEKEMKMPMLFDTKEQAEKERKEKELHDRFKQLSGSTEMVMIEKANEIGVRPKN